MRSEWYNALGVKFKEECISCLKDEDKKCELLINVEIWSI